MTAAQAVLLEIAPPERIRSIAPPIDIVPAGRRRRGSSRGAQHARHPGRGARRGNDRPARRAEGAARHGASICRSRATRRSHGLDRRRRAARRRPSDSSSARASVSGSTSWGTGADVARLLPALDVFALSSLYEGLPCAVAEAMTLGIPVVATAVNSVPEIVLAGKTGLLAGPVIPRRSLARSRTCSTIEWRRSGWRRALARTSGGSSTRTCSAATWRKPTSLHFGSAPNASRRNDNGAS